MTDWTQDFEKQALPRLGLGRGLRTLASGKGPLSWLARHPKTSLGLGAGAVGTGAGARMLANRKQPPPQQGFGADFMKSIAPFLEKGKGLWNQMGQSALPLQGMGAGALAGTGAGIAGGQNFGQIIRLALLASLLGGGGQALYRNRSQIPYLKNLQL